MEYIISHIWEGVFFSPIVALIALVIVYIKFRLAPDGSRRSLVLYAFGVLVVGIVASWIGILVGVQYFCAVRESNLCGLGGYLFGGPLAFTVATVVYLYFWVKNGKAP